MHWFTFPCTGSSGDLSDVLEEDDPIYVSSPIVCESYRALADYSPQGKGEIKLKEGQLVEVVEKYANGGYIMFLTLQI